MPLFDSISDWTQSSFGVGSAVGGDTPPRAEDGRRTRDALDLVGYRRDTAGDGQAGMLADLPKEAKTVAFSVAMQYGPGLEKATPRFWKTLTDRDWTAMDAELRNFKDNHKPRREAEADYLRPLLPPR